MTKYRVRRHCIIIGHKLRKGEIIEGPPWIVDIALKQNLVEKVRKRKNKKSITEE